MEAFLLDETEETPRIEFNKESGMFSITGRSLPEDAVKFYETSLAWMNAYKASPNDSTELVFHLDYFNSSSAKQLVEIMIVLEGVKEDGKEVVIKWKYDSDDELMLTRGKEIESIIELPFVYESLESDSDY